MTINRGYSPNHKIWDHITRITPNVEYSESHRLNGGFTPARWLPISRYDQDLEYYKVVSTGKVVALDGQGNVVPAGLKKAFNVATGSNVLSYVAADATYGTINLVTGVAVTGAITYTEAQVTAALRERGLIRHDQKAFDFISWPIGIAPCDYYQAPGADTYNPATLTYHNFRPQASVAVLCDYVATYPLFPAKATTETVDATRMGGAANLMERVLVGTDARDTSYIGFFSSAQIAAVTRYAGEVTAGDSVVALMVLNYPVAFDTTETPIATGTASCLVREVDSITSIVAAGDYYWDYEMGVLFLYESGGNAVPSPWVADSTTITYYHYMAVGDLTNTLSTYACATGNLDYGDFVTFDKYSNIIKADLDISAASGYDAAGGVYSVDPEYDDESDNAVISIQVEQAIEGYVNGIIGQVVAVNVYGEGAYSASGMERVRTVFEGASDPTYRQPGSATGGRTDQLTYAGAAERMVVINLIGR